MANRIVPVKMCRTSDGRVYVAHVCAPGDTEEAIACRRAYDEVQEGVRKKGIWFGDELPPEAKE